MYGPITIDSDLDRSQDTFTPVDSLELASPHWYDCLAVVTSQWEGQWEGPTYICAFTKRNCLLLRLLMN